jgi:hypothetical protein
VSPASTAGATSLIVIVLTVLLALSLVAIIRTPPLTFSTAEQEADGQPGQPGPLGRPEAAMEPPTGPLPRRIAGESGRIAREFREPREPADFPSLIGRPGVRGAPPWGPAPKPPGPQ